jgi:quinoprotein glucose dehydrogenase
MHAYDSETGKLLWQFELPLAGLATPATYMVDGKQYVVIAAGGGRDPKSTSGGKYIAFTLP